MQFQPSAYSLVPFGDPEATSDAPAGKKALTPEQRKARRLRRKRKKALAEAKRRAILVPAAIGGGILLLGLAAAVWRASTRKPAARGAA